MNSEQPGRVAGKTAIVTGAASGIGEATARRLAEEGASVTVADIDEINGKRVAAEIREAGGESVFIRTDLSRTDEIEDMVARTEERFGRLDILHNNAIAFRHGSATELDEAGWDLTLNVGLKAVFLASKFGIPVMRKTGGGAIINTGSVHSLVSFATCTAYDSAKAGILGLTRVLALDYGPEIRVNAVLPGAILTLCGTISRSRKRSGAATPTWCRPGGSATAATSPTPSSTSLRTRPPSSPAPTWPSTAACSAAPSRTQPGSHPSTPRQAMRAPTTISTAPIDASRVRRPARPVCRAPMLTPATAARPMSTARG